MGKYSSVFLIYGIKIKYSEAGNTDTVEAYRLMQLIIPDLIDEYGEDVWSCFDNDKHENDYYCLNFTDPSTNESELFIACYSHEHECGKCAHDCLEVTLPTTENIIAFQKWCVDNNVDQEPKFYTKLHESV
jgi:hypothetical protein